MFEKFLNLKMLLKLLIRMVKRNILIRIVNKNGYSNQFDLKYF